MIDIYTVGEIDENDIVNSALLLDLAVLIGHPSILFRRYLKGAFSYRKI